MNQAKLLESITDMQLGNITPNEWLQEFTEIVGCTAIGTIAWVSDDPDKYFQRSSEKFKNFPLNWLVFAEQIIQRSGPEKLDYLDEMAKALGIHDPFPDSPLHNRNLLIAVLDKDNIRTLIFLQNDNNSTGWSSKDRKSLSIILPGLRKAHELHKMGVLNRNHLDIASKILDGAPRGIVALSPKGHIFKANKLALELFATSGDFRNIDGKLHFTDRHLTEQFNEKLAAISAANLEHLHDFVWNRSFSSPESQQLLQFVLRAYPLDEWNLESNPYDRFVGLFIHTPENYIRPSAEDLKDFYGLTGAQSRLVVSLLDGNNITDAAKQQHITLNTARSHLRSIYATMGVKTQADLMRVLSVTLVNYEPKN